MKKSLALLSTVAVLALTACQSADSGTIKIGYIGALTGDAASIGADQLRGVQMAVDEINAAGGIDGRQVELIAEDGKCAGADAASAAQKLVNVDKVVAIVGGLCSGETLAAAPIAEAAQIVMISPASSSPDVTTAGDFVFRLYPSDAWKTKAIAKYFADAGIKKVAIISENTDYAQAQLKSLIADLPEGAVVFDETVEPGTKDFRSLLTRLKDVDFNVLVSNPNGDAVNAVMVQQYAEQGFTQQLMGTDTMDSQLIADVPESEGVMLVNVPTVGEGTPFEASFEKGGKPQAGISWAAYAYDSMNVLAKAIAAAGTDGAAVRDYLYQMQPYNGVIGTFSFDKNGDPVGVSYVLKKFQSGSIMQVKDLPLE
jgi:branched-chain amino acid transport system substrate-binding protein